MLHTLMHIYGPFYLHSFGLILALGILITVRRTLNHPLRKRIMTESACIDAIMVAIVAGLAGSRLLFITQHWQSFDHWSDYVVIWSGGLSLLGAVLGILLILPAYLRYHAIPILSFFDLIAIHAPLLQTIARLGCFFAGCCFGSPTTVAWAVSYTDAESVAPLCTPLHPTQLYSALLLGIIFIVMYRFLQYRYQRPGQLLALYLLLVSLERFVVDFLRGDREFLSPTPGLFSVHQYISMGIASVALLFFVYRSHPSTKFCDQS